MVSNFHLPSLLQAARDEGAAIEKKLQSLQRTYREINEAARTGEVTQAAQCFVAVRAIGDMIDEAVKELHKLRQALQTGIIPERFQLANVTTCTVDDHRVTISTKLSVTMTDKVGGMEWLRDNGLGDIVQETVNAQTLASAIKKKIEDEGMEPPDEMFNLTPVMNTSATKVKPK